MMHTEEQPEPLVEEEVTSEQQEVADALLAQPAQLMSISSTVAAGIPITTLPCVVVSVNGKRTIALLDSGSTATFIDQRFTLKANCNLSTASARDVQVAGGGVLTSSSEVQDYTFAVGKHKFTHSFRALHLSGYDMVLGCDWMGQFSPISFHFDKQEFHMTSADQSVMVLPICPPSDEVIDINSE
jgi:hypothetical protein